MSTGVRAGGAGVGAALREHAGGAGAPDRPQRAAALPAGAPCADHHRASPSLQPSPQELAERDRRIAQARRLALRVLQRHVLVQARDGGLGAALGNFVRNHLHERLSQHDSQYDSEMGAECAALEADWQEEYSTLRTLFERHE